MKSKLKVKDICPPIFTTINKAVVIPEEQQELMIPSHFNKYTDSDEILEYVIQNWDNMDILHIDNTTIYIKINTTIKNTNKKLLKLLVTHSEFIVISKFNTQGLLNIEIEISKITHKRNEALILKYVKYTKPKKGNKTKIYHFEYSNKI